MPPETDTRTTRLLDCTLRDGGYYNSWDFSSEIIESYINSMISADIDVVELGFRFLDNNGFKGPFAYTTDPFIESLEIADRIAIGVMLNASDLSKSDDLQSVLKILFPNDASNSPVKLVRIACHAREFIEACKASASLTDQGYLVGINLMQITQHTREDIISLAEEASKWPVEVLYFADSMGSLTPSKTSSIVSWLREKWDGQLGIHTHDNQGLALQNTLEALDAGVNWLDSTVTGMGRGPGNTKTEELVIEIGEREKRQIDLLPLLKLIRNHFAPMKSHFKWGKNPYYYLAGKYGLHPTYVQEMLEDSRFSEEDILSVIEYLRKASANSFDSQLLKSAKLSSTGSHPGQWEPVEFISGNDVLLLGNGPGTVRHRAAIEDYIKKYSPVVFGLNAKSTIANHLIDIRLACHPVRLLADYHQHAEQEQPLVTPKSALSDEILSDLKEKTIFDFGVTVAPNRFETHPNYCIIPSMLVAAYAIAVATSGGARRILIAGFDGYEPGDPRNDEMQSVLDLYAHCETSLPLVSLTATSYSGVEIQSVYGHLR